MAAPSSSTPSSSAPYNPPKYVPPDPHADTPAVRFVGRDFASQTLDTHQYLIKPMFIEMSGRKCDCLRQVVASLFCGLLCIPCACTRVIADCTGCLDPMRVNVCGKERAIPGLEMCSANDCTQICGDERGYGHNEYARAQDQGSGLSRKTLDKINICAVTALCAPVGLHAAGVI